MTQAETTEHESDSKSLWQRFRQWRRRVWFRFLDWWDDNYFQIAIILLSVLLLTLYLAPSIFISVPAGHSGVMWLRFFGGTVLDRSYPEGIRVKAPWDLLEIYDLRLQLIENEFDVLSSDGLSMKVEISTRFRLLAPFLPDLHKNIGPDYINKMLVPEIGAHAREQIARYRPEQIYTSERVHIQDAIKETVRTELTVKYLPNYPQQTFLHVEDVFIRGITLPVPVEHAIKEKLVQRHVALSYEYRLERERMERKRKAIEARGIQDFQTIVSQGISEQYLQWKGIDATLELARSNNSKIVIIGAGEDGLPIILGGFDTPTTSGALAPGAAPAGDATSGAGPASPEDLAALTYGSRNPELPPNLSGLPPRDQLPPNATTDVKSTFSQTDGSWTTTIPGTTTVPGANPLSSPASTTDSTSPTTEATSGASPSESPPPR